VESPHVLADSFRANKNGCRVSQRKDGECSGDEEAGTRGLEEGGDGEERVGEGSIRGRPDQNGTGGSKLGRLPAIWSVSPHIPGYFAYSYRCSPAC
jgi:hypothetical protein